MPLLSIHFHRVTRLASTPFAIFTYDRKSTELTSNAQPGELIVTLTRQKARFLRVPAFGPTPAAKSSKMRVKAELSEANATPTVPALQPLPSVSTLGLSTATLPILGVPEGGRTGVAAGAAGTANAVTAKNAAIKRVKSGAIEFWRSRLTPQHQGNRCTLCIRKSQARDHAAY
jgi:hypothetical protein